MDQIKIETMESAATSKKSVINQMSTHVWNLFAKTNLFALCCVGAFLSLVGIAAAKSQLIFFLIKNKMAIIISCALKYIEIKHQIPRSFFFSRYYVQHRKHSTVEFVFRNGLLAALIFYA